MSSTTRSARRSGMLRWSCPRYSGKWYSGLNDMSSRNVRRRVRGWQTALTKFKRGFKLNIHQLMKERKWHIFWSERYSKEGLGGIWHIYLIGWQAALSRMFHIESMNVPLGKG
ncbi:hypothetical protein GG344DRAFT_66245 [Lentinula edodes]|nr:hypothetical protein GG344DRAFT_66245 [Lentinula edodes]